MNHIQIYPEWNFRATFWIAEEGIKLVWSFWNLPNFSIVDLPIGEKRSECSWMRVFGWICSWFDSNETKDQGKLYWRCANFEVLHQWLFVYGQGTLTWHMGKKISDLIYFPVPKSGAWMIVLWNILGDKPLYWNNRLALETLCGKSIHAPLVPKLFYILFGT